MRKVSYPLKGGVASDALTPAEKHSFKLLLAKKTRLGLGRPGSAQFCSLYPIPVTFVPWPSCLLWRGLPLTPCREFFTMGAISLLQGRFLYCRNDHSKALRAEVGANIV